MPQSKDNSNLSAKEMQESEAWAHERYDKCFVSQLRLLEEPKVCTAQDVN